MTVTSLLTEPGERLLARLPPFVAPAAVAAASIAATAYIAGVDPHEAGHYPTCPSLYLTGFYCPGCGSLRAIHDLAHLDLAGAWGMNPLAVLVLPWLAWRWIRWVLALRGVRTTTRPAPGWAIYTLLGAVVVYTIARNIPVLMPYLAP
ncbi:DUF2752 domain-containing protein [Demequina capsici]|uniref:DUF2752 domain-containing protein n=1 Tax=Demequina capsici TaxID=3075620 RepID=A0AA96F967_9MICO|nr:DUF2752 domain-containing protein [Demequina sp. PMTSA13]WNM26058.1 DUF2752 domain-containing protein [Demequina sp. PMTSA13]